MIPFGNLRVRSGIRNAPPAFDFRKKSGFVVFAPGLISVVWIGGFGTNSSAARARFSFARFPFADFFRFQIMPLFYQRTAKKSLKRRRDDIGTTLMAFDI
jgi:hypothetical protein